MRRSLSPINFVLLILIALLLIAPGLATAHAQTTPTPAITNTATETYTPVNRQPATATLRVTGAPFITGTFVEPAFPAVMLLQVIMDVPLERIRSAKVHIYQAESGLDVTENVDLTIPELARVHEKSSLVSYPWLIDPATAPALFSYVNFEWTVTLNENVTANVFSGFIFQDARLIVDNNNTITAWRSVGSEADKLQLFTHNSSLSIGVVQTNVLRVLNKLRQQTGLDLSYKFILYDPGYKFCDGPAVPEGLFLETRTNGGFYRCKVENAIAIYRAQGYQVIERASTSLDQLQNQIDDVMIREAYGRLWRASQPPAWFREGLFQLYQPNGQVRALQLVRDASRTDGVLSLSALDADPALSSIDMWRSQSYLMLAYLASRYGADAPFALASGITDIYTFKAALATLFNTDEAQVYADWQRWLFTADADAAVNWTPYLGVTPTRTNTPAPTVTRSPTSSIPTETRTPSPQPTNVPLVTFTDVPPTATNTARAPGSLRSPTPRPTPTPEGPIITLTRSPLLLIGVVAFLVVIVALVLGVVLRRRR